MVSSVSGMASASAAISNLLRAQTTAVAGLKTNQQATQAIINQLQENVSSTSSGTLIGAAAPNGGALPRGSLIDVVV